MPWSFFEQNHIFGLMYGIKDERIRRKLGYRTEKHRSLKRRKHKYKRNSFLNKEQIFGSDRESIVSPTDSEMSPIQKTSDASIREKFKITDQKSNLFTEILQNLYYD
jgi:hypothetical protein